MPLSLQSVDRSDAPPLSMPNRFQHDVIYFVTPPGSADAPATLGEREYFIRRADAHRILEDGVITIVSPLDSAAKTELEITEDHERFLEWLLEHNIQHVRLSLPTGSR